MQPNRQTTYKKYTNPERGGVPAENPGFDSRDHPGNFVKPKAAMVKIIINSISEAKAGVPIVPGTLPENTHQATEFNVGILEKGTEAGRTSVMIVLKNPDGTFTMGQCTAREFEAIAAALKGAKERFGDIEPVNPNNN